MVNGVVRQANNATFRMNVTLLYLLCVYIVQSCRAGRVVLKDLTNLRGKLSRAPDTFQPAIVRGEGVFRGMDDLKEDQMGNRLSKYFEGLACSDIVGFHFVYRAKIIGNATVQTFFNALPQIRLHPRPRNVTWYGAGYIWRKTCPAVTPYPHAWSGAWNRRPLLIAEIMHTAVRSVYANVHNISLPVGNFSYIMPYGNHSLPFVPSVVVLFRCVDILEAKANHPYGFVNFNAYLQLIPKNASTIYILTEPLNYLGQVTTNQLHCKELGEYLVDFLHLHYPRAIVAIRRGHPIDSVAMLVHTLTLVSAPSTFSLFPGIANRNTVYMMPGGVWREQPFVQDNFSWIIYPEKINPGAHINASAPNVMTQYKSLLTVPLVKPVEVTTEVKTLPDAYLQY